jgi:hypothetical protein
MKSLAAALLIAALGCSSSPTEPEAGEVTVRYGQTVTVAGQRVSFTEVTESRCPKDLVCVWAGDAAVTLESGGQSLTLHTNPSAGAVSGELAGLVIALVEVSPEPAGSNPMQKTEYRARIRVSEIRRSG